MAKTRIGSLSVGSVVKLRENGSLTEFFVCAHNYESGLNGAGRTLFLRKYIYDLRQWHNSDSINAYGSSNIDAWLTGTYKNMLSSDVQAAMGKTKFYVSTDITNDTVGTLERPVFLLSREEITDGGGSEGSYLGLYTSIIAGYLADGTRKNYWCRSSYSGGGSQYNYIESIFYSYRSESWGNAGSQATISDGSRPAFTLPASYYINDDGTVSANTAPSTPSSITVPDSINGGSTITVSWGASSDAESNLSGYKVERSTNGGSTWSQIYQGSARQTTDNVAFGTESVMYRVRAYDAEGLHSGYRSSAQVTVLNNHAPSAPAGIAVPEEVKGGGTLAVTWQAATDPDGDALTYSLERQHDSGTWSVIHSGAGLSFTDSITKGWQTVRYRVRAKDIHDAYGPYATSDTREVDNNTAPVITCALTGNLGIKSEGFTVSYSVADPDEGDTVTVTEILDGKTVRTLQGTGEQSFSLMGEAFMKVLNGSHTVKLTASDGKAESVHTLTFTKAVTKAVVTLAEPMEADAKITLCVLSVTGSIPKDAKFKMEVTNNGNDETPIWQDCTAAVQAGANVLLENETAANGFAFNFRLSVERGPSGQGGYITSIQGGFQ